MTPKDYLTKKSFCTLPWLGVYIQPDGDVRNCAITKTTLGNINNEPLEDILHNHVNQDIKKDMLQDVLHPRCGHCHLLEKNQKFSLDSVSNRIWYLKTLKNNDLDFFDNTSNYKLNMLDLRWKNTCNFACIYCGPDLSSAWAKELNMPQRINDEALQQSLNYIYSNLDTVEHIYLAGGEPLLIKENLTLLKQIYQIKPSIEIRINTNLSIINNEIYQLLKKFKNVHWTVSVDGVGQEFEYVRYGGSWDQFVKNLQQLRQDFEKINFNSTWCIMTAYGVLECIDFLQEMGFHENSFVVNPVDEPRVWHVGNLPDSELSLLKDAIKSKLTRVDPKYALYNSLTLMLNYISIPFEKNIQATFDALEKIDARRKIDSSKIFTDLYKFKEENNHGKTI
jgi:radical SAM protein with 4Fe4S-binding SPASM domain